MAKKPMKLAMFVPSFRRLGPVIVAELIASKLSHIDYEVTFVSMRKIKDTQNGPSITKNYRTLSLEIGKIPMAGDVRRSIAVLNEFDVVHAHSFWPTLIAAHTKIKKISTVHNNPREDFGFTYGRVAGKIMTTLYLYSLKKFDTVVAISEHVKDIIHPIESIVIHNGIEDYPRRAHKLRSNHDEINLVSVSSLSRLKNLNETIEIVGASIKSGLPLKYTIVGDGPCRSDLESQVSSLQLKDSVTFTGELYMEEVYDQICKSDFLLHPSLSEGFGLVVVESFMLGRPVIAKPIPAMKEIIDHAKNGYIYSSKEDLLNFLSSVRSGNVGIDTMQENARKKFETTYSSRKMGAAYSKEYTELTGNS